jgi:hypothetical protein
VDEERQITEEMGKKMADALGCPYFETSSKFSVLSKQELRLSSSVIAPADTLVKIVEEKERKSTWKLLDEWSIPTPGT